MANKIKAKLALQLREAGVSANKVYATHRIQKKSQKGVLDAAASLGITYADIADLPDDEVYRMLFPDRNRHVSVFEKPDWEYVHKGLAMAGALLATGRIDRASVAVGAARIAGGAMEYDEKVDLSAYDSAFSSARGW